MRYLFVHQNMPGQYKHLAQRLAQDEANTVVFVTKRKGIELPGIHKVLYEPKREPADSTHPYLRLSEAGVLHGQEVVRKCLALHKRGFTPDIIIGHPGWGEMMYLRDLYPNVPSLQFLEFYYRADGSDVGFDPAFPVTIDTRCRIRTKNLIQDNALATADAGICPTFWQFEQYPEEYRYKISVIHDGVDTKVCMRDDSAALQLPDGRVLTRNDEVITYVARNLEPYRGFPTYMRVVEELCKRRPNAHFVIIGGDDVSYGRRLPEGQTYRAQALKEVTIDPARVHFLGRVPYDQFLKVLQVSSAHVYLTYPFVLSWSMLEAMACECLVIGSATPPVEEVIKHGKNGLLVDFWNHQDVADRVCEVLEHPDGMAALRRAARRQIVRDYELEGCIDRQMGLIDALLAGKRPVAPKPSHKPGHALFRAVAAAGKAKTAAGNGKAATKAKTGNSRKTAASKRGKTTRAKGRTGKGARKTTGRKPAGGKPNRPNA